jgi:small subunit ribosomal protein S15
MAITKEQKSDYVSKFGLNEKDTGNTKVQIAILSRRIQELTEHLKTFNKDHNTRRGLIRLVGKRRRLLGYLERTDIAAYRILIEQLGLRK